MSNELTFGVWLLRVTAFVIVNANQFSLIAWLVYATVFALLLAFPTTAGDINRIGDAR